jgi:pimeloyl-ACP methyl ester carboxylesterase
MYCGLPCIRGGSAGSLAIMKNGGRTCSTNCAGSTVPTVIIQGDSDTSTPIDLTGRKTASLIPGSRLRVYEGAAHGLPITHMDRLNGDLLAFAKD